MAGCDLLIKKAVHIPPLAPGDEPGLDRLAAGRQFIQHRDIEIAVEQKAEGARDRSCAHNQQVRAFGFAGQNPALAHAEAMLFINDCKAEVFEHDLVCQHRVGADDEPGAAVRNGGEGDAALGRFHAADEQRDVDPEGLEPVGQRGRVLAGQNFGRSQQGALPAVLGPQTR